MLFWTFLFLAIAIAAGIFGFGGISAIAAQIAQILFVIALVLFITSLIIHIRNQRNVNPPS